MKLRTSFIFTRTENSSKSRKIILMWSCKTAFCRFCSRRASSCWWTKSTFRWKASVSHQSFDASKHNPHFDSEGSRVRGHCAPQCLRAEFCLKDSPILLLNNSLGDRLKLLFTFFHQSINSSCYPGAGLPDFSFLIYQNGGYIHNCH
jgi:hypothetical protein